jgi:hypothetical protein
MLTILKIFKAELIKLAVFMLCFSSSIAFLMIETKTDLPGLLNYIINSIKF